MTRDHWEQRYQLGDTPWDKGAAAPALIELLAGEDQSLWGAGPIVVPGCGAGHDVRALAAATGVEVIGVDLAPSAIERASGFPCGGGERYLVDDFLAIDWPPAGLCATAIWEHTCFCAIDPTCRRAYARAAARTLEVGGRLVAVFFLNPWDPDEDPRQGPPFGATRDEILACFDPWFDLECAWDPQVAFPGREGREWCAIFARAGGADPW